MEALPSKTLRRYCSPYSRLKFIYSRPSAGIVRGIWNYHTHTLNWGDIGYNFLIDKYGVVYEGRLGSLSAPAGYMTVGGHAAPANTGSVGVSVMGDHTSVDPSAEPIGSLVDVIAWQFGRSGVDPFGTFRFNSNGSTRSIPAISGHLDVSATVCPGLIYQQLGDIRTAVSKAIAKSDSPVPSVPKPAPISYVSKQQTGHGWPKNGVWGIGDSTKRGALDVVLRQPNGDLYLYSGNGKSRLNPPRKIGHGWSAFTDLYGNIDFNGDGRTDVIARRNDGKLFTYRYKIR